MQDWHAYRDQLLARVREYSTLSPQVVAGLRTLDAAPAASGKLDPKIHELVALAVAVTTRCDGCIAVHARKAVERGASTEEIVEVLGVAIALNAGAAMVYSAHVLDAVAAITQR